MSLLPPTYLAKKLTDPMATPEAQLIAPLPPTHTAIFVWNVRDGSTQQITTPPGIDSVATQRLR